jgi:hypothetical protein
MSMKKQPEGVRRVARGERRVVDGKKQAPDAYDLYLGETHLGWSERRPKGKWAGFRLADFPGGAGEPFADHTALVEWLLAAAQGDSAPASMADVMKAAEGSATLITDQQVVAAYDEGTASEEVLASADAAAVADDDPGPTAGQGAITSGAEGVTITEVFETVTGIEVGQDFEAQVAAAVPSLKSVVLPHFQSPAEAAAAPWEYPKPDPQPAAPLPPKTSQDFWDSIGDPDADDFPG